MPSNYLASVRYHVIDRCLRDASRVWQWDDIAQAVATHLSEFLPKDKVPSRRTIMADINAMRSGLLGYFAPIEYTRQRGYRYINPRFSIYNIHVPPSLVRDLDETLALLHQVAGKGHLSRITGSILRIAEQLQLSLDPAYHQVIYLEHSYNEPGQKWIEILYTYIRDKKALQIRYAPFNGPETVHLISPAFIKEYNNRWYLFGYHHDQDAIYNLALDRIADIRPSLRPHVIPDGFSHDSWCRDLYGVTRPANSAPVRITFRATDLLARYLDTKPVHPSQSRLSSDGVWVEYSLFVYDNYEIRSKLRSLGNDIVMLEGITGNL